MPEGPPVWTLGLHFPSPHAPRQAEPWAPYHRSLSIPLLFCFSSIYSTQLLPFVLLVYGINSLLRGNQNFSCADIQQKQQKKKLYLLIIQTSLQARGCPPSWSLPVYLERSLSKATLTHSTLECPLWTVQIISFSQILF